MLSQKVQRVTFSRRKDDLQTDKVRLSPLELRGQCLACDPLILKRRWQEFHRCVRGTFPDKAAQTSFQCAACLYFFTWDPSPHPWVAYPRQCCFPVFSTKQPLMVLTRVDLCLPQARWWLNTSSGGFFSVIFASPVHGLVASLYFRYQTVSLVLEFISYIPQKS